MSIETLQCQQKKSLFERILPGYSRLPLLVCVIVNIFCFQVTRLFTKNAHHYDVHIKGIDDVIPFVPAWVLVYITCFATWFFSYLLIARESRSKCYRFFSYELIGKIICTLIFVFFPTRMERPAVEVNDLFTFGISTVYSLDTPDNLFPSLHCFASWLSWRGLIGCKKVPMWYKWVTFVYVPLVFASVLLTKQHLALDIIGGVAVAEIGFLIGYITRSWRMYDRKKYPINVPDEA